jgi:adenosylcobinamide-phosphate synthase
LNRGVLLPAAYLLDQIAGDPEWFPHPVRIIGCAISKGESALRRPGQTSNFELVSGAVLTITIVTATHSMTALFLKFAQKRSVFAGALAELFLAWTCIAARNLQQEATAVTDALHQDNLLLARKRLARIVGRDTENLDAREGSRAVIETVAESASDGIVAPLFYMALGGVPLAMAYKAVSTLDSMVGHADRQYFYFGKAAARLDDIANYLPSRLSALSIVAAAQIVHGAHADTALQTWQRDSQNHKSPNAGQPESAMAGALRVSLGGDNTYAGELTPAQRIGQEFPPPTPRNAVAAVRLVSVASFIGLGFCVLLATLVRTGKRG